MSLQNQLKKLSRANLAVFYIKAVSKNVDSQNKGLWVSYGNSRLIDFQFTYFYVSPL